jgi:hypothetical protein
MLPLSFSGEWQQHGSPPFAGTCGAALALRAAGAGGSRRGLLRAGSLAAAGAALTRAVFAVAYGLVRGIHRISPWVESEMPV